MDFSINLGAWNSIFAVPSCVVDKHIKVAGGAQLKVLLWILRHAGERVNTETLAGSLSMHTADVRDAVQYWVETGLLTAQAEKLYPSANTTAQQEENKIKNHAPDRPQEAPKNPPVELTKHVARPRALSRPQKPDAFFVAQRMETSSEIAFLMQEAQVILGRPISNGDAATLLMLHDNDGLPVDVIIMIMQYAISLGKNSMKYIEKLAISWAMEEIDSIEKAESKIRHLDNRRRAWRVVEKTMGIDHRSPTAKEEEMANRWICDWGFKEDLIREAYERCVNAKGKYISGYIDSIIKRWQQSGVHTLEQARHESQRFSKSEDRRSGPSYDIDEYENSSIFD